MGDKALLTADAGPALGLLELASLARALPTVDALMKRATVALLTNTPISPGKQLVLFRGEVAEVEESFAAAIEAAGAALVDRLLLPYAHASLWPLLGGKPGRRPGAPGALCLVETASVAAALLGADAAAKCADITLTELRTGAGIGGKGAFVFAGALDAVEAAADAARSIIAPALLVELELVAQPHESLVGGHWLT